MPGNGKYPTITPHPWGPNDQSKARQEKRKVMFGTSPVLLASVTDQTVLDTGNTYLFPTDAVKGNPDFPDGVKLDFSGETLGGTSAPDFTKVKVGGAGLPGTPWSPNQASPGISDATAANLSDVNGNPTVNVSPTTIPDSKAEVAVINPDYTPGDVNTASPSATSPKIANIKLGQNYKVGFKLYNP